MHQALALVLLFVAGVERQRASGAARYIGGTRGSRRVPRSSPSITTRSSTTLARPPATSFKRQGIDTVLYLQHARGERLAPCRRQHRHGALRDDRAGIHFGADEMDRRAMHANACRKCAFVCVEAGKRGSREGWMLSIRSRHASTNSRESIRMKPAEADDLDSDEA